jgi:pyrimidine operon attenuation protein / uracil phosphoribosyltransferase
MGEKTLILDNKQVSQRLNRLAWQIYEQCSNESVIIAAGIGKNGFALAQRIAKLVESISNLKVKVTRIELNKDEPLSHPISLEVDAEICRDKTVLVIDDVSNSGKTLMYGVKPFLEFPVRSILTLVLVDRDHNRYPVKTNFVGLSLSTTLQEHISVVLSEHGDSVTLD